MRVRIHYIDGNRVEISFPQLTSMQLLEELSYCQEKGKFFAIKHADELDCILNPSNITHIEILS